VVVVLAAVCAASWWALQQRRRHLIERYGDAEIAHRIMRGMYWQGQTAEQLREALGEPADIDQKAMKTKVKEIWKYRPTGKRRYGLKITLDDGVVVGWDEKD
jgi:hypothetical protein